MSSWWGPVCTMLLLVISLAAMPASTLSLSRLAAQATRAQQVSGSRRALGQPMEVCVDANLAAPTVISPEEASVPLPEGED